MPFWLKPFCVKSDQQGISVFEYFSKNGQVHQDRPRGGGVERPLRGAKGDRSQNLRRRLQVAFLWPCIGRWRGSTSAESPQKHVQKEDREAHTSEAVCEVCQLHPHDANTLPGAFGAR